MGELVDFWSIVSGHETRRLGVSRYLQDALVPSVPEARQRDSYLGSYLCMLGKRRCRIAHLFQLHPLSTTHDLTPLLSFHTHVSPPLSHLISRVPYIRPLWPHLSNPVHSLCLLEPAEADTTRVRHYDVDKYGDFDDLKLLFKFDSYSFALIVLSMFATSGKTPWLDEPKLNADLGKSQ